MRPRTLRRLFAGMAAGAVLAGTGIGFAARADAAPSICGSLDSDPRVGTVVYLVGELVADGWTPYESGGIIAEVVIAGCPEHLPVLERFVEEFAPAPVRVDGRFKA